MIQKLVIVSTSSLAPVLSFTDGDTGGVLTLTFQGDCDGILANLETLLGSYIEGNHFCNGCVVKIAKAAELDEK